jgi:hypothetical protein
MGGDVKWWDDDMSDPVCGHVWQLIKDTATNNTTALESNNLRLFDQLVEFSMFVLFVSLYSLFSTCIIPH